MKKTFVAVLAMAGTMSATAYAADREIKVDDRLEASADVPYKDFRCGPPIEAGPSSCSLRLNASWSSRA